MVRQNLVHNLRKEYEVIADEIQSSDHEGMDLQPLGNETIIWPRENRLCYPLFVSTPQQNCRVSAHEGLSEVNSPLEQGEESLEHLQLEGTDEQLSDGNEVSSECVSSNPPLEQPTDTIDGTRVTHPNPPSPTHHPPSVSVTHPNPPAVSIMDDCESVLSLLPDLPQTKEGLVELKAQLSLELLWLKQAIYSRQNVCTAIVVYIPCMCGIDYIVFTIVYVVPKAEEKSGAH